MKPSRREFLAAGMGAAALGLAGCVIKTDERGNLAGEDGSDLWLRYRQNPGRVKLGPVVFEPNTLKIVGPAGRLAQEELKQFSGETGSMGVPVFLMRPLLPHANEMGAEDFLIRASRSDGELLTLTITGGSDLGLLYGSFHLIRLLQTNQPIENLNVRQSPLLKLRMMNHWDNMDGSIERGYAGRSLWNWAELPDKLDPRLTQYARANASIGINGTVLNNVNANARFLSAEYLRKAAAIAEVFRPWGIRVYLSANFSAPVLLDRLPTADPLNPTVATWWKKKADEIYSLIPDFGGFLVKANSEGQPGPQDFGRTHADGANMMAEAVAPHGGNIIWRAFIYDESVDPDRAKRAYIEFTRLEGQFKPNVLVQVKNGAIDFQPREPFHPLFGALPKTPVLAELQATQEYLGQAKHLVYLGTMWKEFLDADTYAKGAGSTVGKVVEGKVHPYAVTGMACVLNTGTDVNWCGHDFSQANWYAFGRLAWDHTLSAEAIAEEWIRQTWTQDASVVKTIRGMMMESWEDFVSYTMPLGLHHLIGDDPATGDRHYAPKPWNDTAQRRDWTATYYHQASAQGIGFDRTRNGDKAVEQYFPEVRDLFNDVGRCPEKFLLWFHRLPWDHRMKSGRTLWDEICRHYFVGAAAAAKMAATWDQLAGQVDPERHKAVAARLAVQARDAALWRDQVLAYFQKFSGKANTADMRLQ